MLDVNFQDSDDDIGIVKVNLVDNDEVTSGDQGKKKIKSKGI